MVWMVGWSMSRPRHRTARKKPGTRCTAHWMGPRAGLGGGGIWAPSGFDPRNVHPLERRYADCGILALDNSLR